MNFIIFIITYINTKKNKNLMIIARNNSKIMIYKITN